MIFINLVAEIVHDCCDFYGGAVNKNIGDAFLLIWKCKKKKDFFKCSKNSHDLKKLERKKEKNEEDESKEEEKDFLKILKPLQNEYINRVCDLAFFSTVQTLIRLQKSIKIRSFLENTPLAASSSDNSGLKSVDLCFGLHFGWAIEGPIGSSYKIDLSYLSENVNIASRLQDVSKVYKTNIVISENFYKHMSDRFKKLLRPIDRVTLKGCGTPMDLYTFDSCFENVRVKGWDELKEEEKTAEEPNEVVERYVNFENKKLKILTDIKKWKERKKRKRDIFNISYDLYDDYLKDDVVESVRVRFPKEYMTMYEDALKFYLNGNWKEAKKKLESMKDNYQYIEDNIAEQLFQFMNLSNFESPSNWCGFRKFFQK